MSILKIQRARYYGLGGREQERTIDFDSRVTILFGANGSGKTSLLELIHAALANDPKNLSRIPFDSFSLDFEFMEFGLSRFVTRPLRLFPEPPPTPPSSWRALAKIGQESEGMVWETRSAELSGEWGFEHVYLPITRMYDTMRRGGVAGLTAQALQDSQLDAAFREVITGLWKEFTREILVETGRIQQNGLANILFDVFRSNSYPRDEVTIENPDRAYDRLSTFLQRQGRLEFGALSREEFLERLPTDDVLKRIVYDVEEVEQQVEDTSAPRSEFENLIAALLGGNKNISFTDGSIEIATKTGFPIDIGRLSSGEKQLVRLALDTVAANGKPIIIDEPELSLHIDWQRSLLRNLMSLSKDSQFIVATHSPDIMAEFPSSQIIEI